MIEVSLLGPPRVERDGVLVAFDTRKAMALLAHLVITDRPRPRDALADLLWPGTDPEHARGALRRTLSALRGAVGAELVEATRDHVRLVKGPGIAVDVDRFRDARARQDLEHAVDLFRGDFLEGFGVRGAPDFEDWAQIEGEGLRRELIAALADLAGTREAAGDAPGALLAAQRWLSIDRLHEPAHRALIRLYAATGDRASALVQYRDCVRTLSRELGVAPLTETTALYEAINRGSHDPPRLDAVPRGMAAAASLSSPFVGRDGDLLALRSVYDAITTDGRIVVVEGEAGIGKTRLAEELLSTLRDGGGTGAGGGPTRMRPRSRTHRSSRPFEAGSARETTGLQASGTAPGAKLPASSPNSPPSGRRTRPRRWTGPVPRPASWPGSGTRSVRPWRGASRGCCSSMMRSGATTQRSGCSPTVCADRLAAGCW